MNKAERNGRYKKELSAVLGRRIINPKTRESVTGLLSSMSRGYRTSSLTS